MEQTHPKYIIKHVRNSKIHAVKIVTWEEHSEIATVPHVFTWPSGEPSEGQKAAQLFAAAPEVLDALKTCAWYNHTANHRGDFETCDYTSCDQARAAIEKATL